MQAVVYLGLDGNKKLICSEKIWIDKKYIGFQKGCKNNYVRYVTIVYKTDDYNADRIVCEEFLK